MRQRRRPSSPDVEALLAGEISPIPLLVLALPLLDIGHHAQVTRQNGGGESLPLAFGATIMYTWHLDRQWTSAGDDGAFLILSVAITDDLSAALLIGGLRISLQIGWELSFDGLLQRLAGSVAKDLTEQIKALTVYRSILHTK